MERELPTSTFASLSGTRKAGAGKDLRAQAQAPIPEWVRFAINDGSYAIPLHAVERVVPAAEVTALPGAPAAIRGVANIAGEVLPVFDLHRRFSLPARRIMPADHFLIVRAAGRRAILLIDSASGIMKAAPAPTPETDRVATNLPHVAGIILADDGLVLIHDVDAFLSATELLELDAALAQGAAHAG